jgi:hypothetical protein
VPKITFSCEQETGIEREGHIVVEKAKSTAPSHSVIKRLRYKERCCLHYFKYDKIREKFDFTPPSSLYGCERQIVSKRR